MSFEYAQASTMKLTTILAAFAGLAATALLEPRAQFRWEPGEPYPTQLPKKGDWEVLCNQALDEHDCPSGIIYVGQRAELGRHGDKTGRYYHNVQEAVESKHEGRPPKRLRVYDDGTSDVGWSRRDRRLVQKSKHKMQWQAKRKSGQQLIAPDESGSSESVAQKALLSLHESADQNGRAVQERWKLWDLGEQFKRRKLDMLNLPGP